jgi:hypothetical protein
MYISDENRTLTVHTDRAQGMSRHVSQLTSNASLVMSVSCSDDYPATCQPGTGAPKAEPLLQGCIG